MTQKEHILNYDEVSNLIDNIESLPFKMDKDKIEMMESGLKKYRRLERKVEKLFESEEAPELIKYD